MLNIRLKPTVLLIGALYAIPSLAAEPEPGLHLYGGVGWAYDDNLLRVADDQPAFDNQRSDSWVTTEAGLLFDQTYSRQRIAASARLSKVDFNHFKQLDYKGKDFKAIWYWQLGRMFSGEAGATYVQTLAPYTDFRSNQRNLRQQRRQFFEASWRMHPSFKTRAYAGREKFTYELAAQAFNNRTENTVELEAAYTPRSGSTVGLVLRRIEGDYPNRRPFGQALLNDDFTQNELKVRMNWLATGTTTLQALVGYARREQPSFGPGTTSGVNGRATLLYYPKGKVRYNASVWRDFAPLESSIVSYTLNKGASVGASWEATGKLRVDASAIYERRSFNPRFAFDGSDGLSDSLKSASVRATWFVRRNLQLTAGYQHQARSGSALLGTGRFSANTVTIGANAQF